MSQIMNCHKASKQSYNIHSYNIFHITFSLMNCAHLLANLVVGLNIVEPWFDEFTDITDIPARNVVIDIDRNWTNLAS